MLVLLPIAAIFFVLGLLVARPWIVLLSLVWVVYFLGVRTDLWGNGTGDGWQYGLILLVAVSAVGALLGLVAHRSHERGGEARGRASRPA